MSERGYMASLEAVGCPGELLSKSTFPLRPENAGSALLLFFHTRGMFLEMNSKTGFMPVKPHEQPDEQKRNENGRGGEDKSIANDREKSKTYPLPDRRDRQMDNQPEFTENHPNRKEEES